MTPAPKVESKTPNPDKLPYWSWKDDDFIAKGKISSLAIFEVFAAMVFYYWLASTSAYPWTVLLTFMLAPLLLLRSKESVKRGQQLLMEYHLQKNPSKLISIFVSILAFIVGFAAYYWLSKAVLIDQTGLSYIWRTTVIVILTVNISIALSVAVAEKLGSWGLAAGVIAVLLISVMFNNSIFLTVSILLGISLAAYIFDKLVSAPLVLPGFVAGLCIRAWFIRVAATLTFLRNGFTTFNINWRESVLVSNLFHSPALLPGAEVVHISYGVTSLLKETTYKHRASVFPIFIIGYVLVATLYRWNIKASALIWGPIALGLSPPNWRNYTEMREQSSLTSDKWLFATSVAFLIGFVAILAIPYLPLDFIEALPKWMNSKTITSFRPQPNTLRYVLLCLFSLTFAAQLFLALRMRTQHDKPLSSAADFTPYLKEELKDDLNSFTKQAKQLRRILKINTALAIFIIWVFALKFALDKWPNELQKVVWDWLKPLI